MKAILILIAALAGDPAMAQVVSEKPDSVSVVLYQEPDLRASFSNDPDADVYGDPGLAAVTETRTLDLPAGRSRIVFRGVADQIVPQTTALQGLNGRLIERNYDFDLLSPGSLIEKAVDGPARLVRTNPKTGQVDDIPVTLRTGPDGMIVQQADGHTEALGCSGLPEKLVFARAPAGLTASPTLSVTVEPPHPGRYMLKLSYLATGLRWGADYVARIRPDGRTLDLTGWLTLSNHSATTFGHAPTQVVAGRLARQRDDDGEWEDRAPGGPEAGTRDACWPIGLHMPTVRRTRLAENSSLIPPPPAPMAMPSPMSIQEVVVTGARQLATVSNLGDYKLYSLPEPTTVAARQTKQVAFLDQAAVPFDKIYEFQADTVYAGDADEDHVFTARIILKLSNKKAAKLGMPLPGGQVAMYAPGPRDGTFRIGEDRIKDTPVGLPIKLFEGQSPDITVTARQGDIAAVPDRNNPVTRSEVRLTVRNAGPTPAPVAIRLARGEIKILKESRAHTLDAADTVWSLSIPSGGQAELTYTTERP